MTLASIPFKCKYTPVSEKQLTQWTGYEIEAKSGKGRFSLILGSDSIVI